MVSMCMLMTKLGWKLLVVMLKFTLIMLIGVHSVNTIVGDQCIGNLVCGLLILLILLLMFIFRRSCIGQLSRDRYSFIITRHSYFLVQFISDTVNAFLYFYWMSCALL